MARFSFIFRAALTAAALVLFSLAMTGQARAADEKVFRFSHSGHDMASFKPYVDIAATLKDRGRVQMPVSDLADKDWQNFPEGGCPWREYACYVPTPWMFYPHEKIKPFIDPKFVEANRKLMLERAALIGGLGLEGIFEGKNSHYLPEAFFQKYPQYCGPRVDHPRRSNWTHGEAFSMCLDLPETQEMVSSMMADIKRNVPLITLMVTGTNDAGAGLCWAEALYPGPNGPRHCQGLSAGDRALSYSNAVHRGAIAGGGDITLIWGNVNFWRNEDLVVRPMLPENTYLHSEPGMLGLGTRLNATWPFMGVVDILGAIQSMQRYNPTRTKGISFNHSAMYSRGDDTPQAVAKLVEIATDCMDRPVSKGLMGSLERLQEYAGRWGGEANKEKVFQALYDIDQAFEIKNAIAGAFANYSEFYCGVSMRHLNRPLVIKPELLTAEEESYFLPYVFNPRESEARMDYIDFHGGRMRATTNWNEPALSRALSMADRAGAVLQHLEGAPEGDFLRKMGLSVRMWTHEVRSIHNFFHAQLLRDQYKEILEGPKRIPAKIGSWEGDPGNLEWTAIMRDELDNSNELIALLEDGGLEMVARATDPRYEDTFLMGPDLIGQMKKKVKIMREHWLDVQDYLAPPHK